MQGLRPNSRGEGSRHRSSPATRAEQGLELGWWLVLCSVCPSVQASPSSGHRGHGVPILEPTSSLEHRGWAAVGAVQVKRSPSALHRRLAPRQGSAQPKSPLQLSGKGLALYPSLAWQYSSLAWQKRHIGQRSCTAGGPWRHGEEMEVAGKSWRQRGRAGSMSQLAPEHLCHAAAGWQASHPRCQLCIHFPFSTDQICKILASCKFLGSKQALVTRLDEQPGRPQRGAAARLRELALPHGQRQHPPILQHWCHW